ncbi:putative Alkylhydroperoxidase AhpD [Thiomonas arsenitoxydans]|uniref:Alkylhydroperoxidase AhpD n=2 Tax=Thiomonas arsenitoxydans (strain DSM 22701 / CIP 110005 / 3As) TaxID=426114 RepID=D6CRJ9_THIA3|nr:MULTISPECIES: carboxymuconolactone decarboxylase family protein [Thiomonas]MDE2462296.1 carboxymuconolactone decarboxylase family protein [Alphaproteobacteria bacterium]MBN8745755.1 carboxymuconolactone decarboxylase family protein [Thiomonas arsenitoxydans]MBN8777043.1 carboxymuconolactone decarboxylase family protein [Thiomonas arsenitoxydans]ODU89944.1 MAG: alkylhydroperoxidase [Thiomonas sp. SCN 64-16]CAZ87240.1 putative Alkylhydroperoxidase AhpD [Thiomonas arsenitoxydans]
MYSMDKIKHLDTLGRHAPAAMQAFAAFDAAAMAPGALSVHTKELIALAVAHTTQCPYCIQIHVDRARKAGCSDAEIAEAVLVTAALRAGAAVTHGTHCFA